MPCENMEPSVHAEPLIDRSNENDPLQNYFQPHAPYRLRLVPPPAASRVVSHARQNLARHLPAVLCESNEMKSPLSIAVVFLLFCVSMNIIARTIRIVVDTLRKVKQLESADAEPAAPVERVEL